MKKIIALLLVTVLALSLFAGCGAAKAPAAEEPAAEEPAAEEPAAEEPAAEEPTEPDYASMTLEELKPLFTTVVEGKLTVATSPDFAPYEFYAIDENGDPQLAGFDMAFAQYLADFLGLELEVVPMDFDGVKAEIANGSVDIGLAGLSPDPDRMDAMDFSDIYYLGGQSFVTVKDKAEQFTDLASANKAEYSIGAQTGSIQYDLAVENTPDSDIVLLTKVTDIVAELIGGKLDGAFIETIVAESYAKNYSDLHIVCDVPYDVAGSAVGIAKGNPALVAAINLAVAEVIADGSMDKFVEEANDAAAGDIIEGLLEG